MMLFFFFGSTLTLRLFQRKGQKKKDKKKEREQKVEEIQQ